MAMKIIEKYKDEIDMSYDQVNKRDLLFLILEDISEYDIINRQINQETDEFYSEEEKKEFY